MKSRDIKGDAELRIGTNHQTTIMHFPAILLPIGLILGASARVVVLQERQFPSFTLPDLTACGTQCANVQQIVFSPCTREAQQILITCWTCIEDHAPEMLNLQSSIDGWREYCNLLGTPWPSVDVNTPNVGTGPTTNLDTTSPHVNNPDPGSVPVTSEITNISTDNAAPAPSPSPDVNLTDGRVGTTTSPDATDPVATNPDVNNQDHTNQDATNQDTTNQGYTIQDATNPDYTNQDTTNPDAISVPRASEATPIPGASNPEVTGTTNIPANRATLALSTSPTGSRPGRSTASSVRSDSVETDPAAPTLSNGVSAFAPLVPGASFIVAFTAVMLVA